MVYNKVNCREESNTVLLLLEEVKLVLEIEQSINEAHRRTYTVHDYHHDKIDKEYIDRAHDEVHQHDEHADVDPRDVAGHYHIADIVADHGGEFVPEDTHSFMVRWYGKRDAQRAEKHMEKIADFSSEEGG